MKCLVCVLVINLFLIYFPSSVVSLSQVKGEMGRKLCGREFIRAVISVCAGSRWKRLLDNQKDPFQTSADKDYAKEMDSMRNFQRMFGNDRNQKVEPSFAGQVVNEYNNQYDQIPEDFSEYLRQIDGGSNMDYAFESSQMLHQPWARSVSDNLRNRPELSRRCCIQGCIASDIRVFC
ncbi:insulin-like peptide INSL5 [Scyliorhinus canicula]|uniref:insulin-like peptide INSL5 n=1 Tax=Scyliorhinus canicula TaxID=7830 RepID=UPI0018F6E5D6|nr:insulin-like peptide INSL5 [Scyliorhinus canicula]